MRASFEAQKYWNHCFYLRYSVVLLFYSNSFILILSCGSVIYFALTDPRMRHKSLWWSGSSSRSKFGELERNGKSKLSPSAGRSPLNLILRFPRLSNVMTRSSSLAISKDSCSKPRKISSPPQVHMKNRKERPRRRRIVEARDCQIYFEFLRRTLKLSPMEIVIMLGKDNESK
jgi:hypothetical protein